MNWYFGLRVALVLLVAYSAFGHNFVATRVQTKLPSPMYMMSPYYDGQSDYIYLLGGVDGSDNVDSILRFDVCTETIEEIAKLPDSSRSSPLEADDSGNLFYFGDSYPAHEIYKYDIVKNSLKTVGEFPFDPKDSAFTKNSAGNVLTIGGHSQRDIFEININSENIQGKVVGQFPVFLGLPVAVKVSNNTALVFGSASNFKYLALDLTTFDTEDVARNSFPEFERGMTVTCDGNYVYLFGGEFIATTLPGDGIIKLDPIDDTWESLKVQNFPVVPGYYYSMAPEVVWVEKLNRIYMFGGGLLNTTRNDNNYLFSDDIYYIDMNPTSTSPTSTPPTTTTTEEPTSTTPDPLLFSCDGRIDGTHPNPSDCSKYIACRNETIEGVHSCVPPLLYDPAIRNCNHPSLVECELNCEDKEDGPYPHPHDCRLFIICFNHDILVSWCDPPLLFDPQELQCTLPELVQC